MLNGPLKIYKQDEWNEMTESEHEEMVGTPYTEDYEAPPYDAVYYDDKPYLLRTQEYKLPEITAIPSKGSARFVKLLPRKSVKQFSEELEN
jgi:hypothetical protein